MLQDLEEMVQSQGHEEDELDRAAARMGGMDVGTGESNAGNTPSESFVWQYPDSLGES